MIHTCTRLPAKYMWRNFCSRMKDLDEVEKGVYTLMQHYASIDASTDQLNLNNNKHIILALNIFEKRFLEMKMVNA